MRLIQRDAASSINRDTLIWFPLEALFSIDRYDETSNGWFREMTIHCIKTSRGKIYKKEYESFVRW